IGMTTLPAAAVATKFAKLTRIAICACLLYVANAVGVEPPAATGSPTSADTKSAPAGSDRFFEAIVKLNARAIPDARSSVTLGAEREGTGIVIGDNGLILTIGYLIVEADDVQIVDHRGRTLPGRVVGYDHPTGLGLVRAVVPL